MNRFTGLVLAAVVGSEPARIPLACLETASDHPVCRKLQPGENAPGAGVWLALAEAQRIAKSRADCAARADTCEALLEKGPGFSMPLVLGLVFGALAGGAAVLYLKH